MIPAPVTPPTHPTIVDPFIFRGDKIGLRPITIDDCTDAYVDWLNDPVVTQFLETRFEDQTTETVMAFIMKVIASETSYLFAIIESSTDRHIGNIKIGPINSHHKYADISYFIGERSCWGKGYAKQAIKAATTYAFNKLKLLSVRAGSYAKNAASIRALKRVGFHERGIYPEELSTTGDARDNHVVFSITLREYKSLMQ